MITNTNKTANRVFIVLLLISVTLISLRLTTTVQVMKRLAYSLIVPNVKFSSHLFTKTGKGLSIVANMIQIYQENIELKKEKLMLEQQLVDYKVVLEENTRLRNLLDIKQNKNFKAVFANVIVRDTAQWYQFVIIDKGSDDGIEKGAPVFAVLSDKQICVFGRVLEAYFTTSKVALITNSFFSVSVQLAKSNIDCICDGDNDKYLKLFFIPQSVQLQLNDELVTSKLSIFDRGINVGKIISFSKTTSGEYQDVLVEPYCQSESVYEVGVLIKNK